MKRRAALTALAWGCGSATLPSSYAHAAPPLAGHVLVWGPDGCWVASPEGGLHRLADGPSDGASESPSESPSDSQSDLLAVGTRPALTALGLWLVNAQGALRCWAPGGDRTWHLQRSVEFAAPVHAFAASPDGRWVAAAHGEQLSVLDTNGTVRKAFEGASLGRELRGPATALFALSQRRSFVATWPALGEVWEISVDPDAAPIFDGLVHDYRMGEAIAKPGYLGARRAPLGRPLPHLAFADPRVPWLAGMLGAEVAVVHLDVRRRIAVLRAEAANPAGAALRRSSRGHGAFDWWLPAGQEIQVFDTARWTRTALHTLPGPVRQVQAVGDTATATLWAQVEARGGTTLWRLDESGAGVWQPLGGVAGPIVALSGTPQGSQFLVLRGQPPAALQLEQRDARGDLQAHWPLPAATVWHGIAAWPAA